MAAPPTEKVAANMAEALWLGEDDLADSQERAKVSLAASVARAQGLKPFPAAAARILQLLGQADYDLGEVVRVIEGDPALASRMLRIANSPLMAASVAASDVQTAVMRLGARGTRDAVGAVATMGLFKDLGGGVDLRNHCAGVSVIARALAEDWRFPGSEQVFLCGLLHDVGRLLWLQCGEVAHAELESRPDFTPDQAHIVERQAVGYDHGVLAGHVLEYWDIPAPLPMVVAFHHQAGRAYELDRDLGLMVALLRLADRIDYSMAANLECTDELLEELTRDGSASFSGVSAGDLRHLWEELARRRDEATAMFD